MLLLYTKLKPKQILINYHFCVQIGDHMEKKLKYPLLVLMTILLIGCNNALERSLRTVEVLQDTITQAINQLNEIQVIENQLQSDFEATMKSESGLASFNQEDSPILTNLSRRSELIEALSKTTESIQTYAEELQNQSNSGPLPTDQVEAQVNLLTELADNLGVYTADYQTNINYERTIYHSLTNPEIEFTQFFQIFDEVERLFVNNYMNLEHVLGLFEPINTQLINFKIYLINLEQNQNN